MHFSAFAVKCKMAFAVKGKKKGTSLEQFSGKVCLGKAGGRTGSQWLCHRGLESRLLTSRLVQKLVLKPVRPTPHTHISAPLPATIGSRVLTRSLSYIVCDKVVIITVPSHRVAGRIR